MPTPSYWPIFVRKFYDFTINWDCYNDDVLSTIGPIYEGRRLLLKDVSPILGGVAYWGSNTEATVVDPEACPDPYERLYQDVKDNSMVDGIIHRQRVLRFVRRIVEAALPHNERKLDSEVRKIARQEGYASSPGGYLVNLGLLLDRRVAVCRQQAAALGYLVERFASEGYIPEGSVSIDANRIQYPGQKPEGHAWVRYTPEGSTSALIYDVGHKFYGSLNIAGYMSDWPYARPEEVSGVNLSPIQ